MGEINVGRDLFRHLRPFVPLLAIMAGGMVQPWGLTGAIPFFAVSLVLLVMGIRSLRNTWREESAVEEAVRLKNFISRQRHDWMNHVQVLLGYLALGKTDRMKEYLEKLAGSAGQERLVAECKHAPLAVALMTLHHRDWRRNVELKVDTPLSFLKLEDEVRLCRMLGLVVPWLEETLKAEANDHTLVAAIDREAQAAVVTMEVTGGTEPLTSLHTRSHEWAKLRNDIKEHRGELRLLGSGRGIEIRCPLSRNR
jgi:hypothetical protein